MRYPCIAIKIGKIHKTENPKSWQGCGTTRTLIHCWWESKLVQPLWKMVWRFLPRLNMHLPCGSAILLLVCIQMSSKLMSTQNPSMDVYSNFIMIAKTRKQPKCPSLDEWINQLWDIQTMKYYSVLK